MNWILNTIKYAFFSALLVMVSHAVHGQTLRTQAEVDAWDQSLTEIPAGMSVTISGPDIQNISALFNLTDISGSLSIYIVSARKQIYSL